MENEAIMEIELSKEDEKIKIPEFINVIEEVTEREEYKNSNMAKRLVKKQLVWYNMTNFKENYYE